MFIRKGDRKKMMIMIEAIIREEQFEDVKEALNAMHINGMTVSQVMGCGTQHGFKQVVRGSEVQLALMPKLKIEVAVSSGVWEQEVITCIRNAACTGSVGDGKIFSYALRTATKIRTGETGPEAIYAKEREEQHDTVR